MGTWTKQEEQFLKENYEHSEHFEIGKKLGRTTLGISHKLSRLGLHKRPRWTEIDTDFLKKNYSILDNEELSNKFGRKRKSISDRAYYLKIKKNPPIIIIPELKAIIDGVLLGDGYVRVNGKHSASICVNQREDRLQWLLELQRLLLEYTIVSKIYNGCKEKDIVICGKKTKQRKSYVLITKSYPTFLELRQKWYPNNKKIVPKDVDLSPIALAQWYMGDGYRFTSKTTNKLCIYCDGFQRKEVEFLRDKLNSQYHLSFHLWNTRNVLELSRKKHEEIFLQTIKPYKVDCFNYKWRENL